MGKVQLKNNVRLFDFDDTDFLMMKGQVMELPEKHLRSYSIKHHLFHGLMKVVEGEYLFNMKHAKVYVGPDKLYAMEFDKFFKKDLEFDTITFIEKDEVPKEILEKLGASLEEVEEVDTKPKEKKSKPVEVIKPEAKPEVEAPVEEEKEELVEESKEELIEQPLEEPAEEPAEESKEEFDAADVNKDGKVDFGDVIAVGKKMFQKSKKSKKSE